MDVGQGGLNHYKLIVFFLSLPLNIQIRKIAIHPPLAYSKGPNKRLLIEIDGASRLAIHYLLFLLDS